MVTPRREHWCSTFQPLCCSSMLLLLYNYTDSILSSHFFLTRSLSVQVHISHWFCFWRAQWFTPPLAHCLISMERRGGWWEGGRGRRNATRVCDERRWRRGGALAAERPLPQCLILHRELLALSANVAQLFGESIETLPQLTDLVSSTIALCANLWDTIYTPY